MPRNTDFSQIVESLSKTQEGGLGLAVVTGGGTAGHINPAIAIGKQLEKAGFDVLYIGSDAADCLDREMVERSGIKFMGLSITTPLLKPSLVTIKSILSILAARRKCKKLFKQLRPVAVLGTGGFVSLPVMLAAQSLGINNYIHEQNVQPGFTNKLLAKKADRVFLTFSESRSRFGLPSDSDKFLEVGLPMANPPEPVPLEEYRNRATKTPQILVLGGSLGSAFLNNLIIDFMSLKSRHRYENTSGHKYEDKACKELGDGRKTCSKPEFNLTLSSGQDYYEAIKSHQREGFKIVPFITDMRTALRNADLQICRAGSSTVFEGLQFGVPAIVVPSPNVANDHQRLNALYWEKTGAAICIEEKDLTVARLDAVVTELLSDRERLVSMKLAAEAQSFPKAAEMVAQTIAGEVQR